jgi:hypothetical protein
VKLDKRKKQVGLHCIFTAKLYWIMKLDFDSWQVYDGIQPNRPDSLQSTKCNKHVSISG